ncbi:MAG: hypothetical protein H7Y10_03745 [Flavobacterium sp.]|nr:hypothetical protein [Flavobacterium sp.]
MQPIEKLTHIKVISQILLNYLSDFKAENKTKSFFTGAFKNFVNNFIGKLAEVEAKHFDRAITKEEVATNVIYNISDEYYKMAASVHIKDMQNYITMHNAYQKDKSSIEGICRKVLKH